MHNFFKCLLLSSLLSGYSFAFASQDLTQTVKGQVLDAQSLAPVPGATVMIVNSSPIKGAVTDLDGNFKIEKVPVGRHHVQISFVGYENKVIPEVLVGSGKEVVLNVHLTESIVQMAEVVVTASEQDKGAPLNDFATVSAKSINVEETSRYAATFDDPARAAASFAGVRGAGDDITNEIVIRGNSPRGLLWRVEGVEVPNPNHFAEEGSAAGGISILSNNMLANSDFYTGAFPAQYGNALSGVFDINLRKGNTDKREYAFQAGVLGIAFAAEGPLKKNGKASYLVNYRYSTLSLLDQMGLLPIFGDEEIVFQDLSYKIHLPTQKAGAFSLWGLGGLSRQTEAANLEEDYPFNSNFRSDMGVAGLSHVYFVNKDTFIETKLTASRSRNAYDEDSLKLQVYNKESFLKKDYRLSTMLNQKFNARNTLRSGIIASSLGYDLISSYYHNIDDTTYTGLEADGSMMFLQGFSQWQYRASEHLTFNTGFHYSHLFLKNQLALEPRFGMKWTVANGSSITAGIGLHSRLESASLYLASETLEDGTRVQYNKGLEMSKAGHFVLGYEKQLTDNVRLKAEVYYQQLYNVPIAQVTNTDEWAPTFSVLNAKDGYTTRPLTNDGTGRNYGLELTLEKFLTNGFYYTVTSSLYQSKYTGADGIERNTRFNGNFTGNFIAGKEFKVGRTKDNLLGFNTRVIYAGGNRKVPINLEQSIAEDRTVLDYTNAYNQRLPDYARVDVGISYRRNKPGHSSILSINVQNVTARYNVFGEYFDSRTDKIETFQQLGFLPNLSYRIEF
ncbi:MAG: carboxypeptidase-like regulatory domain-containing protein [Imperialibacter sp.]|uniref:TonB-dependent receptor n=1 Tax=Imperialibacter sp. TaxID=2038411 RepID=UPI0032EC1616